MEYLTHILTFLAGLGAGWTLKVVISSKTTKNSVSRNVVQKNNTAGGDIVGGDMNKNSKG
jgi:hypothetical protein